ncbi:uncharacterized protein IL334_001637 [Kwoniella shivajii]|uniref:WW domain-containing protein n=1 Tax=Kwoniella shivajii TaxID=564305 RepID=A0ABZ1CSG9_9TREE|nr:hypothetical protein IL334_001637 [Kwoniella shivajii]
MSEQSRRQSRRQDSTGGRPSNDQASANGQGSAGGQTNNNEQVPGYHDSQYTPQPNRVSAWSNTTASSSWNPPSSNQFSGFSGPQAAAEQLPERQGSSNDLIGPDGRPLSQYSVPRSTGPRYSEVSTRPPSYESNDRFPQQQEIPPTTYTPSNPLTARDDGPSTLVAGVRRPSGFPSQNSNSRSQGGWTWHPASGQYYYTDPNGNTTWSRGG